MARILSGGSRPAWFDRNPVQVPKNYYSTAIAPHTLTTRWTYTVPTGKKALLEFALVKAIRSVAATTAGTVYAYLSLTPSGLTVVVLGVIELMANSVGDHDASLVGQSIVLGAGDALLAATLDTSTGGTVDYSLAAKLTEFDA